MQTIQAHTERITCLAFSPSGQILASAGGVKVTLWDVTTSVAVATLEGHERGAVWVAFFPDGKSLATTDMHSIRLWDLDTMSQTAEIRAHHSWVYCVAVSPDGASLLSVGNDLRLKLWDVPTQEMQFTSNRLTGMSESIAFAVGNRMGVRDGVDGSTLGQ